MKLLITGAAGFLGSHLCDRFLRDGHHVVGVDNFLTGSLGNVAHLSEEPRFSFVEADVSRDVPTVDGLDGILHFASPASPVDYYAHPVATLEVGSLATLRLLEVARERGARFMVASTSEVYGLSLIHI